VAVATLVLAWKPITAASRCGVAPYTFRPLRGEPRFDRLLQKLDLLNPPPATSP
jgi:hypothetical protein